MLFDHLAVCITVIISAVLCTNSFKNLIVCFILSYWEEMVFMSIVL